MSGVYWTMVGLGIIGVVWAGVRPKVYTSTYGIGERVFAILLNLAFMAAYVYAAVKL